MLGRLKVLFVPLGFMVSCAAMGGDWHWKGDAQVMPQQVIEDGNVARFQFANRQQTPAIFAVLLDGREALLNPKAEGIYITVPFATRYRIRDRYYEVEGWTNVSEASPTPKVIDVPTVVQPDSVNPDSPQSAVSLSDPVVQQMIRDGLFTTDQLVRMISGEQ